MAKAESQEMVSAGTLALLVMIMVSSAFCTNVNYLITKHNCTLPAAQNCMLPLKLLTCPGASAHLPLPRLSLRSPPHLQKRKRGGSLRKVWSIELWNMCNLRFEVLWNSCLVLNHDCQPTRSRTVWISGVMHSWLSRELNKGPKPSAIITKYWFNWEISLKHWL